MNSPFIKPPLVIQIQIYNLFFVRTQTYRELQASVNCHLGLTWVSVDQFLPRSDQYDGVGTSCLLWPFYLTVLVTAFPLFFFF